MRMLSGDMNVYWRHDTLTPENVRAATYGSRFDSGTLIPDVGDVIHDFPGHMGALITVKVTEVEQVGRDFTAFQVTVTDCPEGAA
jgi:hypothetical protein